MPTGQDGRSLVARTRIWRYLAAGAVVLAGVGWLLLARPTVCREQLPDSGTTPVTVCAPPATTDPQTLAFLLVALLLLAPDLTEVGIAGVSIKRAVEEARADAATARADLATLRLGMTQRNEQIVGVANTQTVDVVESGPELVATLGALGLLHGVDPAEAAATLAGPVARPARVSEDARATLIAAAVSGMLTLLPADWRSGTLLGVTGGLTYLAGAELDHAVLDWLNRAPDGPVTVALAGRATASSRTRAHPAVVAAPARDVTGAVLGAVAAVLPEGVGMVAGSQGTAESLEPVAEAFAALAATLPAAPSGGRGEAPGRQS